jgi:hypothetical protein
MLSPYSRSINVVKYSDTSSMLSPYLRSIDTSNKFVNRITRTAGKDSIIYFVGGTRLAIKDSVGSNPAPVGYYGAWQDNNTQSAALSNVGYPLIYRTVDLENQVRVVSNGTNLTRITFDNTGIYNLQFSVQVQNIDNAQHDITIWLRKNGTDVTGSAGFISVPARKSAGVGNEGHGIYGWNYLLSVVAGEYYEIVWSTSNAANVTIQYYAAGSPPPSTASVIATVTQQSGIMAGTGITAINSLTGAAQTMVTGTDSTDFRIVSTGTSHKFNLPTASATNRGLLSSADWTTFNSKQNTITNPVTGIGTSTRLAYWNSTSSLSSNANLFWDNTNSRLGIGTATPATTLDVTGKTTINYSATTDMPLVIKNTNASATTSNVLSFDCSATGADQPVFINLASTNAKGMNFFASSDPITGTPTGAAFQMYSTSSTNFPGQMYFDGGSNNNSSIIFRTAQTSAALAQRMRIFANGNVSISSSATNPGQLFNVAGVSQANQFKLSALNTAPASATATGTLGEIRIVNGFIYVCVATNTWQRTALTTW